MEEFTLKKYNNGNLSLDGLGLKLEIKPQLLLNSIFSLEIRKILDKFIEETFIAELERFKNSTENVKEIRDKLYHKEIHSLFIKQIALIERELVYSLHSDGECIELSKELQEIRDFAYSVWKYDVDYGYKQTQEYVSKKED